MPATNTPGVVISAVGTANGAILTLASPPDTFADFDFFGAFTGATLLFQGTKDAIPSAAGNWFPLAVIDRGLATLAPGGTALAVPDAKPASFTADVRKLTGIRVYAAALASGSLTVLMTSDAFYGASGAIYNIPAGGGAGSFTNLTLTGLLYESATNNVTAFAGGGQAGAVQLTTELNRITTVAAAGDSVKLPAAVAGLTIAVSNKGVNPVQVFGLGADAIDGVAAATGVSQMQGSVTIYFCAVAGLWESEGIGTGYSGSLPTVSSTNNITAFAGGGQGSAIALTTVVNRATVVAAIGDSVKLPPSAAGLQLFVFNAGANSLNVFPAPGDSINAGAVNAAFAVAPGKNASFTCAGVGVPYHAILSA